MMNRERYDPSVRRQLALLRVLVLPAPFIVFAAMGGLYLWRLQHLEHTVAIVEKVWEKSVSRRGRTIVTMAELSFTRHSPAGEKIACRYSFEIGTPSDGFKAGDRLEVVPATGTCQRIDIIGRIESAS